ncbi:hypothetical protein VP01_2737g1 [Puccinia sorghi]|uniref:Uncharacterized protein n=1 Tax=Puccinia sorghi TaxID=27349 RepID=A0A0L6V384_9BASI|nr:hypothetical protein VP01_2737g1 [Puccinia sorghi]
MKILFRLFHQNSNRSQLPLMPQMVLLRGPTEEQRGVDDRCIKYNKSTIRKQSIIKRKCFFINGVNFLKPINYIMVDFFIIDVDYVNIQMNKLLCNYLSAKKIHTSNPGVNKSSHPCTHHPMGMNAIVSCIKKNYQKEISFYSSSKNTKHIKEQIQVYIYIYIYLKRKSTLKTCTNIYIYICFVLHFLIKYIQVVIVVTHVEAKVRHLEAQKGQSSVIKPKWDQILSPHNYRKPLVGPNWPNGLPPSSHPNSTACLHLFSQENSSHTPQKTLPSHPYLMPTQTSKITIPVQSSSPRNLVSPGIDKPLLSKFEWCLSIHFQKAPGTRGLDSGVYTYNLLNNTPATCTHCFVRYKGAPLYLARQCVRIAFTLGLVTQFNCMSPVMF